MGSALLIGKEKKYGYCLKMCAWLSCPICDLFHSWTTLKVMTKPDSVALKIYLVHSSNQGKLVLSFDTAALASEGSNTTLICQDTDSKLLTNLTWSFQRTSGDFVLVENGLLAPGVSGDKYKLSNSTTKLQINQLGVNDIGNYTCCMRGKQGETILSATVFLTVEGKISEGVYSKNFNKSLSTDFGLCLFIKSEKQEDVVQIRKHLLQLSRVLFTIPSVIIRSVIR